MALYKIRSHLFITYYYLTNVCCWPEILEFVFVYKLIQRRRCNVEAIFVSYIINPHPISATVYQ
jgi:hypothetical protein